MFSSILKKFYVSKKSNSKEKTLRRKPARKNVLIGKKTRRKKKAKKYLTHDNGGRPFLVVIDNKHVKIYKVPKSKSKEDYPELSITDYTELIKEYNDVKHVFIGKSRGMDFKMDRSQFTGNTILLEIQPNRYCQISGSIIEFSTSDTINAYDSPVHPNDVPGPIAYATQNVYFFPHADGVKYVSNTNVDNMTTDELWNKYYFDNELLDVQILKSLEIIPRL